MDRKEILISDMRKAVDARCYSDARIADRWTAIPYSTAEIDGVMLQASRFMQVPELVIDPGLCGYYEIRVGMYVAPQFVRNDLRAAQIMLTGDETFYSIQPSSFNSNHKIEELTYRVADLTGKKIILRHPQSIPDMGADTSLAFLRLVPLSEAEAQARMSEFSDKKKKRIFATEDTHRFVFFNNVKSREEWLSIPDAYVNSDVESLSVEYMKWCDGEIEGDKSKFVFERMGDKYAYDGLRKYLLCEDDIYPMLIEHGHKNGLKMYLSLRIGPWGMEYPFNRYSFDNKFALAHPQYKCMDRDGTPINRMSYAYPEVRAYMLGHIRRMLSYGADGISLILTRGTPLVLFEQPIRELFEKRYPGIDCRTLKNEDPRLISVRAEIITAYMREVRALIDSFGEGKDLNVHVHTSFKDNLYYGLDVEGWIKEGLVNKIIVNNDRHWEELDDSVYADPEKQTIDLEKYARWANEAPEIITARNVYGHLIPKEAIAEYLNAVKGTKIRVFCDLQKNTAELAKEEAVRLLDAGIEDFCVWDTYEYQPQTRLWHFLSRLGRVEDIRDFDIGKYVRLHRVNIMDGMQVGRYCPWWGG